MAPLKTRDLTSRDHQKHRGGQRETYLAVLELGLYTFLRTVHVYTLQGTSAKRLRGATSETAKRSTGPALSSAFKSRDVRSRDFRAPSIYTYYTHNILTGLQFVEPLYNFKKSSIFRSCIFSAFIRLDNNHNDVFEQPRINTQQNRPTPTYINSKF